ncbi:MAG: hypothetical protein H0U74_09880 [Bradymonadaceae bacterium]|nr:hypothetical protein [Lujinxingiaceae bacterium]
MLRVTQKSLIRLTVAIGVAILGIYLGVLGAGQFHELQRWWGLPVSPIAEATPGLVRFEGTVVAVQPFESRFALKPVVYDHLEVWTTSKNNKRTFSHLYQDVVSAVPFLLEDASGSVLIEADLEVRARLSRRIGSSPGLEQVARGFGSSYSVFTSRIEPGDQVIVTGLLSVVDGQRVVRFDPSETSTDIVQPNLSITDPSAMAWALLLLWFALACSIGFVCLIGSNRLPNPWPVATVITMLCAAFLAALGYLNVNIAPDVPVGPLPLSWALAVGFVGFLFALCLPSALYHIRKARWLARANEPAQLATGFMRLSGHVEALDGEQLETPYTKKACVHFHYVRIDHKNIRQAPVIDYVNFLLVREHDAVHVQIGTATLLGQHETTATDEDNQRHRESWLEIGDRIEAVGYLEASDDGRHFILGSELTGLPFVISRLSIRELAASLSDQATTLFALGMIGVMLLVYASQGLWGPLSPELAGFTITTLLVLVATIEHFTRPHDKF